MRTFASLSEREVLALAVSLEEEDAKIYDAFSEGLRDHFPEQAKQFDAMRLEEEGHRHRLIDLYRSRFGEHLPLLRREDVKGFAPRPAVWLVRPLGLGPVRKAAAVMEAETRRYYESAATRTSDAGLRQLLGDLAAEERRHEDVAHALTRADVERDAQTERRLFVLQVVQPGLAGLMDGSVSTLAPLFAAAFATRSSQATFLVGLAASVGAGISMGFAEALSDDGSLTGRGRPWVRGTICGLMTTVGGLGHTMPYLVPNVQTATAIAIAVVAVELSVIAWVRHRFMDTPIGAAVFQVVLGGVLVFIAGVLIGRS